MEPGDLLAGVKVVEFCQFLAGPLAGLRLSDLGADVIKVERPGSGDVGRQLYVSRVRVAGENVFFQTINRGKRSMALDLKDPADRESARQLVARADVVLSNFRPGVMERLGLGYDDVKASNAKVVYACLSGYGPVERWSDDPGQDLLVQARSGMTWLNGAASDGPVPFAISVVDLHAGALLVQGILAALVRAGRTGQGCLVETSLVEAAFELQMQEMTAFLNGAETPDRGSRRTAHPYLAAPYGIYPTGDGHVAVAMSPLDRLANALGLPELAVGRLASSPFDHRGEIEEAVARALRLLSTTRAMEALDRHHVWAVAVLDWEEFLTQTAALDTDLLQRIPVAGDEPFLTTRCPIRVNGDVVGRVGPAPEVGQDTEEIRRELATMPAVVQEAMK